MGCVQYVKDFRWDHNVKKTEAHCKNVVERKSVKERKDDKVTILSKDVLWLKYLFFTSFQLSVYSLQYVDYNESDARFTITCTLNVTVNDGVKTFLQARGLKIFHQNVNGLTRKFDMVDHMLKETRGRIDIFGISETHLNSDIMQEEVKVDGYTFIRNDRKTGPGGGVGCFIRSDLEWQRRTDLENECTEAIWLEIFIKNTKLLLVCNI